MTFEERLAAVPATLSGDPLRKNELSGPVAEQRPELLTRSAKLLLIIVPSERGRTLREERAPYTALADGFLKADIPFSDSTDHATCNTEPS